MSRKTCTGCSRCLPLESFPNAGKRGKEPTCFMCTNDARRLRTPLPAIKRDPALIRINNTFNLWHGPVSRTPLRIAA
ncbi:hypothetical protein [Stenotrophomonas bentonitica]|uniref:hypothetical protein n=1 Tax=Stenotrophomonas bentonitica TaxID=1450134 RepID=UPI000C9AC56F|nr:hypothetical protein [Stenotrophomonas bentonitica]